jgi:hypothetical protein
MSLNVEQTLPWRTALSIVLEEGSFLRTYVLKHSALTSPCMETHLMGQGMGISSRWSIDLLVRPVFLY